MVELADRWGDDIFEFVRRDLPKLVGVLLVAFILALILRLITRRLVAYANENSLPGGVRAQQIRTLSGVLYSMGIFVILFLAGMQVLQIFNINIGPLLASAGIAGLAIGFGAQTLVKDVITGFFILVENHYDLGDIVKIADRSGTVEDMSLRRTILRDGDGAMHVIPNSSITVVTNYTRDWSQVAMLVSVAYGESSDRIMQLLREIANQLYSEPEYREMIIAPPEVPGLEKINGQDAEYLLVVKALPGKQYGIARELRRRIKQAFEKNGIRTGGISHVYMVEGSPFRTAEPARAPELPQKQA